MTGIPRPKKAVASLITKIPFSIVTPFIPLERTTLLGWARAVHCALVVISPFTLMHCMQEVASEAFIEIVAVRLKVSLQVWPWIPVRNRYTYCYCWLL